MSRGHHYSMHVMQPGVKSMRKRREWGRYGATTRFPYQSPNGSAPVRRRKQIAEGRLKRGNGLI
jgi:hypothetical protein